METIKRKALLYSIGLTLVLTGLAIWFLNKGPTPIKVTSELQLTAPVATSSAPTASVTAPIVMPTSTTGQVVRVDLANFGSVDLKVKNNVITVTGTAMGPMFFEASFPMRFETDDGIILAEGVAQATSNWMTLDFVPFIATLEMVAPFRSGPGTLFFTKDNPSGEETQDMIVEYPAFLHQVI